MKRTEAYARKAVYARSGGICERCASARGAEWQHRKNRSQGGQWTPANGLHLCSPCHRYVTENPADARENGWSVSRVCDPASVAVLLLAFIRDASPGSTGMVRLAEELEIPTKVVEYPEAAA